MTKERSTITGIELCDRHWDAALERVKNAPIYKKSHRKKEANEVGFLGEVVIEQWFQVNGLIYSDERQSTELDYLVEGKHRVEIKTKDRTVSPKKNYDCSVPLYNHDHQQPDYFIFISLQRDRNDPDVAIKRFKHAYIVGAIDLVSFEEKAKHWKAGEIDKTNGTRFWTDCLNVRILDLMPITEMTGVFKNG